MAFSAQGGQVPSPNLQFGATNNLPSIIAGKMATANLGSKLNSMVSSSPLAQRMQGLGFKSAAQSLAASPGMSALPRFRTLADSMPKNPLPLFNETGKPLPQDVSNKYPGAARGYNTFAYQGQYNPVPALTTDKRASDEPGPFVQLDTGDVISVKQLESEYEQIPDATTSVDQGGGVSASLYRFRKKGVSPDRQYPGDETFVRFL